MVMNLKLRMEKLADNKSWVRVHFIDNSVIIGRIFRIGHDYLEIESYGNEDNPNDRDYEKHIIPLSMIKLLTTESSSFSEAERRRLSYISQIEHNNDFLPDMEK